MYPHSSLLSKQFIIEIGITYPIRFNFSNNNLEPSGITINKGRIFFVSDNRENSAIYELVFNEGFCNAQTYLIINHNDIISIEKWHKLDLEGIVSIHNSFYCIDERDRFIYKINSDGRVEHITHDIHQYNKNKGISFSNDANAGFEGIAYDQKKKVFIIANERDDSILYLLQRHGKRLITHSHISMTLQTGISDFDISDICFYDRYLYLIHRKDKKIIKMNPYNKKIDDTLDYSNITKGLYSSRKGYGFVEGIWINSKQILLLLDSNGKKISGKDYGENGILIILKRPRNF